MRIFLYESVTGGGMLAEKPPPSLLREGTAMIAALAADFGAIDGAAVTVLRDRRWRDWSRLSFAGCEVVDVSDESEERVAFGRLAAAADATLVVAPELDGALIDRCRLVLAAGGRLLGPNVDLVELASDKHRTAEHLRAHGVPAPEGVALAAGEKPRWPPVYSPGHTSSEVQPPVCSPGAKGAIAPGEYTGGRGGAPPYPLVWKRRDGAGSQDVRLLVDEAEAARAAPLDAPSRLERYYPGTPCSVAWLCGPAGCHPLPPCWQRLSEDGRFAYLGGETPLPPPLAARAVALARRAMGCLPEPRGYLGVDLVLGDDPEGRSDCVIEINPRLTTSYVGLRTASRTNLAQAMLDAAAGRTPTLLFASETVEFPADGTVRRA